MRFKNKLLYGIYGIVLMLPCAMTAQEKTALTLEQSVAIALEKNPEIRIAEKEIAKARSGLGEAVAAVMPKVNGSVNFQHVWNIQTQTMPNFIKAAMQLPDGSYVLPGVEQMPDYLQIAFGIDNTFMVGAALTQPLFLGGAGWAGIRMANASKHAAEYNLEFKRQSLIYNTVGAFYACLTAREFVAVEEQAVAQSEANLDMVRKRFDAGSASGFDKMRAEVDLANLRPLLISARNGYQSALTGLRTIMGLPENTPVEIRGGLEYVEDTYDQATLDVLREKAYVARPEFLALKSQKSVVSGGVAVARSMLLPKLFFQTDYSYMAMRTDYQFRRKDFSKGFTSAVSLQVPLFNGFGNIHAYQKARLDYKIMTDSEKQLKDGVAAEVEMTANKFRETREKYFSARESIAMAQEALRLAKLMYEEGASTQLDVMGAQLALTQAKLNYVTSLFEYQMSRYGLRKSVGDLKGVL
jgi:outer membrane protein TolC